MKLAAFRRMTAALLSIAGAGAWLALVPPPVAAASPPADAASPPAAAASPPCAAKQLALRVQEVDSPTFTGMSHGGAFAIVTNTANAACAFSPLPALSLRDAGGATVATAAVEGARFMHPGPVVLPFDLGPGESAATRLRWISGDVYGSGRAVRVTATALVLTATGGPVVATMPATTIWGDTTPVSFARQRFTTALLPLGGPDGSKPGTYLRVGPAGSTLEYDGQPIGRLVLKQGKNGLDFTLDATRPAQDLNNGSISGSVVSSGNGARFTNAKLQCRLAFAFYGTQLTIAQTGDCGFGYGVDASGRYQLAN